MSPSTSFSRRDFLKVSLAGGCALTLGAALTACGAGASQKVTLKHWDNYVTQGPTIEQQIKLFHEANPDITIKRTVNAYDKYADLFNLAEKGGTVPDTFLLPATPSFEEQIKDKWLLPISDFTDYQQFVQTFPNPALNFVKGSNISEVTGKTYSAPFGGNEPNIELWINTKVFKDAGLVDSHGNAIIPSTLDDMLQAARTIKKQSGGSVYGYGFGGKLPYQDIWLEYLITVLSSGGSIGGQNMLTGKYDWADNPVYQAAIEWLLKMKSEGHIIPDSASVDDEGIRFLFSQHKFGMLLAGIWVIDGWKQTSPDFTEYTMDHAPLIDTTTLKGTYYGGPGGTSWAISNKTKYKDAAWAWFKWLYSEKAGEQWVKDGNGTSVFPGALKDQYATNPAQKNFFKLCRTLVKISPQPAIRNPDVSKVSGPAVTPGAADIVAGAYTGQITDVTGAMRRLQDASQKSLEQGIADANAAGAHVSQSDYAFPDWNPLKDYVTKPGK